MKRLLCFVFCLFLFCASTYAQQPVLPEPLDSAQDYEMTLWLRSGEESDTIERLVRLGVDRQAAEYASSEDMDWISIRTAGRNRHALLFVPCVLDDAHVYLMSRQNASWRVVDETTLNCLYDEAPSLDIRRIRNVNFEEVQVHHIGDSHGTGFWQKKFEVFAVEEGKLRLELDAQEVLHSNPTTVKHPQNLDQDSAFAIVPVLGSSTRAIEETRSSVFNGKLTVRRRLFRWSDSKRRYLPGRFSIVEAPPA